MLIRYMLLSFNFLGHIHWSTVFLILTSLVYFLGLPLFSMMVSYLGNHCLVKGHENLYLCFLQSFIVYIQVSDPFWVNLCVTPYTKINSILLYMVIQFSIFDERISLSSLNYLGMPLVEIQLTVNVWIYFGPCFF